jgi:hypothetical protein
MNRIERGGSRNHQLLRGPGFPVGYPDFISIEYQIGWTTLDRIMPAAYSLITK